MLRIDVTGATLAYRAEGSGGDVLLFISRFNGRAAFWREQCQRFSQHFRCVTFDHRGVAPPYSVEQWAVDVVALLDHLRAGTAYLIGHSIGGIIAQAMASAHPERVAALVLSGTWARPDERFRRVFVLRRDVLAAHGTEACARFGAILTAPADAPLPRQSLQTIEARIEALFSHDGLDHRGRILCRTLVIAAADDVRRICRALSPCG